MLWTPVKFCTTLSSMTLIDAPLPATSGAVCSMTMLLSDKLPATVSKPLPSRDADSSSRGSIVSRA